MFDITFTNSFYLKIKITNNLGLLVRYATAEL